MAESIWLGFLQWKFFDGPGAEPENLKITVRCVACKHELEVVGNLHEIPMCPKCFSPMAAVEASR